MEDRVENSCVNTGRYQPYAAPPLYQHPGPLNLQPPAVTPSSPPNTGTHVSCLYPDVLELIFSYLEVRDKGRAAQVCQAWRDASYYKSLWRGVEAKLHLGRSNPALFVSLHRRGIQMVRVLSIKRTEDENSLKELILGIPNLLSLDLQDCPNVTDLALYQAFTSNLTISRHLSLCEDITDSSLGSTSLIMKNLEVLNLGGCYNVTNTGLMCITRGLPNLRWLNLRSCWQVSDQGIADITGNDTNCADGCLNLEYLGLQDCHQLSDGALKHISTGLVRLKSIDLSCCESITDSGLQYLANITSLKELNLQVCDNISHYLARGGLRFRPHSHYITPFISWRLGFDDLALLRSSYWRDSPARQQARRGSLAREQARRGSLAREHDRRGSLAREQARRRR